jgi:DNA repair exonuclease SbcCD nuclease subunit
MTLDNASNGDHVGAATELVVAHTSDLHLGGRWHKGGELSALRAVLDAADETAAQVLILAGDVFDSHRTAATILEGAARMLDDAAVDVVILPGNHDPATPDAVYRRSGMDSIANVHVLGVTATDAVVFDAIGLEVVGVPHMAYVDMPALAEPRAKSATWQISVAHGHWVQGPHDAHRGWLIHDHQIAASGADYVALGHWDVPQPVGDGSVPAFYSGSPEVAKTVNIVRFGAAGVDVRRHALRMDA